MVNSIEQTHHIYILTSLRQKLTQQKPYFSVLTSSLITTQDRCSCGLCISAGTFC